MKASEILRDLAELLDKVESNQPQMGQAAKAPNSAELAPVSVNNTDQTEKGGVFVPPLQAKIELLKKSVNVDNVYDQGGPDEDLTGQGADNEDELAHMKKMAGINVAAVDEAGSDEPLDV